MSEPLTAEERERSKRYAQDCKADLGERCTWTCEFVLRALDDIDRLEAQLAAVTAERDESLVWVEQIAEALGDQNNPRALECLLDAIDSLQEENRAVTRDNETLVARSEKAEAELAAAREEIDRLTPRPCPTCGGMGEDEGGDECESCWGLGEVDRDEFRRLMESGNV